MDFFWPLILIRWIHLGSLLILFGASCFALYDRRLPDDTKTFPWLAWLAFLTACCWIIVSLADIVGDVDGLASTATWRAFFMETGFGRMWGVRLAGLLTLLIFVSPFSSRSGKGQISAICGLSAGLLVSAAWLGHAAGAEGIEWYGATMSYGCHVLGAGVWLGGLVPLSRSLRHQTELAAMQATLERFSRVGMVVVFLIVASGIVNTYLRSVGIEDLIATSYGRVLSLKLVLFLALIGLAATNRWVFLRRLRTDAESAKPLHSLRRSVALEQILGASIVAVAVVLGAMPPNE